EAFRVALREESDRGCALFAVAYLDDALAKLLKTRFVDGPNMDEDLFGAQAPMSTFSSRIKIAFYLGKIEAHRKSNLDTLRKIRNYFAHHANVVNFHDQNIRDRCNNLIVEEKYRELGGREKFVVVTSGLLGSIHAEIVLSETYPERPKTFGRTELKHKNN
ncbi:MAG: MltR family transcriptional regulator, partial [Massilia sp.]